MKIFVRLTDGKLLTVEVEPTDLIKSIFAKIDKSQYDSEKTFLLAGTLVDYKGPNPRLLFAGKQLEEKRTFEDFNIQNGSRIFTVIRLDSRAGFDSWKANQESYLNKLKNRFVNFTKQIELTPEEKEVFSINKDGSNTIPETSKLLDFANQNPNSVVTKFLLSEGCIVINKALALNESEGLLEELPPNGPPQSPEINPDIVPHEPISPNLFFDIVTSKVLKIAALILLVAGLAALTAGSFGVAGFIAGFVGAAAIVTTTVGSISAAGGVTLGLMSFFASKPEKPTSPDSESLIHQP